MRFTNGEFALAAAALLLASAAVWRLGRAGSAPLPFAPVAVASRGAGAGADADAVTEAMDAVLDANPFRFSRSGGGAVAVAEAAARPATPVGPRTPPVVKAILGGPPWQAVLGGVPGQPGEVVALPGTRFGGMFVASITRDTVVVQVTDTTFRLTLRREIP